MTRHLPTAARLLLGLLFFVHGSAALLGVLPQPPLSPEGRAFLDAMAATGYFMPLVLVTETAVGVLLLLGRLVPLTLILLAPVALHIVAFHTFLSPSFGIPLLILGLGLYLAHAYRAHFQSILAVHARPSSVASAASPPDAPSTTSV